jgi:hypothetical protein
MGGPRPIGRDAKYWWAWAAIGLILVFGYVYGWPVVKGWFQ